MNPFTESAQGMQNRFAWGNEIFSIRMFRHLVQSSKSKQLTYLDLGPEGNLEEYGVEEPPLIPVENTNNPVAMFMATEDMACDPADNQWYADQIGDNLVLFEYYDFSHMGFVIGDTQLYLPDLVELYESYNDQQ